MKVGFSRINIDPMPGIRVAGYYIERRADGILDSLEANALAVEQDGERFLMISIDNVGIKKELIDNYGAEIAAATGVPTDHLFISCTHTHTGPETRGELDEKSRAYVDFLGERLCEAAEATIADLKEARMGYGVGEAPGVAFIRRFRMKDGSIRTNPGVNNPDIVAPIGEVDERVGVIRFDREGAETLLLLHFANHPDVIGGCKISADWPGMLRRNTEKALDNVKCIFFNGAEGDVNHVNVHPAVGYQQGGFRDTLHHAGGGYSHANDISHVILGGVLQVFDKVHYVDVDKICLKIRRVQVPSHKADPADLPEARRIHALHIAGRDHELPYEGMMLTTAVARAERMIRMENAPDHFEIRISGFGLGPVLLLGISGEPFTGVGLALRDTKEPHGFEMILPVCSTNGHEGYFPMRDSYDEGGYEAVASPFRAGVAEKIIEEGLQMMAELSQTSI